MARGLAGVSQYATNVPFFFLFFIFQKRELPLKITWTRKGNHEVGRGGGGERHGGGLDTGPPLLSNYGLEELPRHPA